MLHKKLWWIQRQKTYSWSRQSKNNTANDVEKWFDTSNYDENDDRPPSIGKNTKEIVFFKDELGGKIMKKFCGLRAKTWAYLMDDDSEKKKVKGTNKCVIKRGLMVKN